MKNEQVLHRLLLWLALYVLLNIGISVYAGKPAEALVVLSNLVSGFAGAAFAMMRHEENP